MWTRLVFLMLATLLTAGTLSSCADVSTYRQPDYQDQWYQERDLNRVIREQSG